MRGKRFAIVFRVISVEDAQALILENVTECGEESVSLPDAFGRVLREDVVADRDVPPFDRARMDGYALRAEDTLGAPVRLKVIGEVAAGRAFAGFISKGEAVRIMTGAPLPSGADAVQKFEATETSGTWVTITESVRAGENVTWRAAEARRGQVILQRRTRLGPPEMAVLATFGYHQVKVSRKPRVGILSTGSEIVEASSIPLPVQIRDSNSYAISAYVRLAGAEAKLLGIVPDDESLIEETINSAVEDFDVVIVSGGVSMGDYDLVTGVLRRIGARIFFDRVSIHPGKPTVFATHREKLIFGLPGNPVSVAVTCLMFVYPALNRMMGYREAFLPVVEARLTEEAKHAPDRRSYLPGLLLIKHGEAEVQPLPWGGSSDLVAFVRANSLIIVPEGVPSIKKGGPCKALALPNVECLERWDGAGSSGREQLSH